MCMVHAQHVRHVGMERTRERGAGEKQPRARFVESQVFADRRTQQRQQGRQVDQVHEDRIGIEDRGQIDKTDAACSALLDMGRVARPGRIERVAHALGQSRSEQPWQMHEALGIELELEVEEIVRTIHISVRKGQCWRHRAGSTKSLWMAYGRVQSSGESAVPGNYRSRRVHDGPLRVGRPGHAELAHVQPVV